MWFGSPQAPSQQLMIYQVDNFVEPLYFILFSNTIGGETSYKSIIIEYNSDLVDYMNNISRPLAQLAAEMAQRQSQW